MGLGLVGYSGKFTEGSIMGPAFVSKFKGLRQLKLYGLCLAQVFLWNAFLCLGLCNLMSVRSLGSGLSELGLYPRSCNLTICSAARAFLLTKEGLQKAVEDYTRA